MNKAWQKVQLARHPKRITAKHLINSLFDDFMELKGDRLFRDDGAIISGIGMLDGRPITVIAEEKGNTTQEKIKHNFGMPHPEGYRKALRLMKQAEKFNRPIFTIIDTPGAYPGLEAEERGQARAIAYNLFELSQIRVPIIVCILSEGGSGGALAIGVGDYIMMYENAIYSVLSPEGFASILYKDSTKASEAAEKMKLTSNDLFKLKVIDEIIKEKEGLHINPEDGLKQLKSSIKKQLSLLNKYKKEDLIERRYQKFRRMGVYEMQGATNETTEN